MNQECTSSRLSEQTALFSPLNLFLNQGIIDPQIRRWHTAYQDHALPSNVILLLNHLQQYINSAQTWVFCNKLKLKDEKTRFSVFDSLYQVSATSLWVKCNEIPFKTYMQKIWAYASMVMFSLFIRLQTLNSGKLVLWDLSQGKAPLLLLTHFFSHPQLTYVLQLDKTTSSSRRIAISPSNKLSYLRRILNQATRPIFKKFWYDHTITLPEWTTLTPRQIQIEFNLDKTATLLPTTLTTLFLLTRLPFSPPTNLSVLSDPVPTASFLPPGKYTKSFGQHSFKFQSLTVWNSSHWHTQLWHSLFLQKSSETPPVQKSFLPVDTPFLAELV